MTKEELQKIIAIDEGFRIELTTSTGNMDKFQEAICAFANDMPSSGKKGYLLIIAFRLPERIDSQVILDCDGAEDLLGNGDMLFGAGKSIDCIRVQCAFVDTPEVNRICQFVSQQQGYISPFELPDPYFDDTEYGESHDVDMQHLDPLFEDAARLIVMTQEGSTSLIQRKFAIGYNRAGRLMDQLEKAGIVGAVHGSKPREVLIMDETSLENLLSQLISHL